MPSTQALFANIREALPTHSARTIALFLAGLVLVALLAQFQARDRPQPNFPLYGWDTSVTGTAKKRWMWDSLKLLREGYAKVSRFLLLLKT